MLEKPLPKSKENDPMIPLNYRGISLLSCTLKLFTSIINKRVVKFLDEQAELEDEQNGFHSCVDHVFALHSIINPRLEKGESTFASFIDFRKAFDGLDRDMLLYKMIQYGIDGGLYFLLKNMHANTEACIKVNMKCKLC